MLVVLFPQSPRTSLNTGSQYLPRSLLTPILLILFFRTPVNCDAWVWSEYKAPSNRDILFQLKNASDSATGRDGLPYSAWRANKHSEQNLGALNDSAIATWAPRVIEAKQNGSLDIDLFSHTEDLPDLHGINDVVQSNVPKSCTFGFGKGVAVQPSAIRPLGCKNCSQKAVSRAHNAALQPVLQLNACKAQCGFIRDRFLLLMCLNAMPLCGE